MKKNPLPKWRKRLINQRSKIWDEKRKIFLSRNSTKDEMFKSATKWEKKFKFKEVSLLTVNTYSSNIHKWWLILLFYYFTIFFIFRVLCVLSVECRPNLNFREIKTGKIQFNIIMGVTSHQESYAMQHRTSTLYLVSQLQHQKVEDFISRPHCHHHKFSH